MHIPVLWRSNTIIAGQALALAVLLASCGRSPSSNVSNDLLTRHGFVEGTRHRALLARAITIVDSVVDDASARQLRPSWSDKQSGIPVYLVGGEMLGATEYAFVPSDNTCIFVNDDRVDAALALFAGNPVGALAVRPEDALALMLLHESGHIANGDAGSYTPSVRVSLDELTATLNDSKSRELRADAFAIDAIRAAAVPGRPMPRFLAGNALTLALTNISWNLATRRLLDAFAANALRERRLFLDRGYSHPNFELRFLIMNYQLHPTETSLALLTDFLEGRQPKPRNLLGVSTTF